MAKLFLIISVSFIFLSYISFSAFAEDQSKLFCIKEANQDWKQAIKDANSDLRAAKATCRFGPEVAACMAPCLPDLRSCLQPVFDSLKSCRVSCGATLVASRKAARESLGCGKTCNGNAGFQKAAMLANIAYQQCRLGCRATNDSLNARAACRAAYGQCVNACK